MVKFQACLTQFNDRYYIFDVEAVDADAPDEINGFDGVIVNEVTDQMYLWLRKQLRQHGQLCYGNQRLYITEDQLGSIISNEDQVKRAKVNDVEPPDPDVKCTDELLNEDTISRTRRKLIKRIELWVQNNTMMLPIYQYMYIEANQKLVNAGIVITDENREEKYLEVISNGDDELIDALAQYLDAQSDLEPYPRILENYRRAMRRLSMAITFEDLCKVAGELPGILRDGM